MLNADGLNAMKVNMREESESENLFRRHLMVVLLHWLVRGLRTRAIMTRDPCYAKELQTNQAIVLKGVSNYLMMPTILTTNYW